MCLHAHIRCLPKLFGGKETKLEDFIKKSWRVAEVFVWHCMAGQRNCRKGEEKRATSDRVTEQPGMTLDF